MALPASSPVSCFTRKRRCFPSPTATRSTSSHPGARSVSGGVPRADGARARGPGGAHVPPPRAARVGPGLDLLERLAADPILDGLPLAVQCLELERELLGPLGVVGEEQLERGRGMAEPAGGVDPRREPVADR